MVNDTNDYDDVEPDDTEELSVADPVLGKTRLLSRQCDTCIFGPGKRKFYTTVTRQQTFQLRPQRAGEEVGDLGITQGNDGGLIRH